MRVIVSLNYQWLCIENVKCFTPVVLVNCRPFHLQCKRTNAITILIKDPTTNIDLVVSVFYFFFESWPQPDTLGQVISRCSIIYSMENPMFHETLSCILFLKEDMLEEILLYLPPRPTTFLRELVYSMKEATENLCPVCLEETSVRPVHEPPLGHLFCLSCILQFKTTMCPLCRRTIS